MYEGRSIVENIKSNDYHLKSDPIEFAIICKNSESKNKQEPRTGLGFAAQLDSEVLR